MRNEDHELLQRYLDGSIDENEVEALNDLLLNSVEARSTLRSLATLDLGLNEMALGESPSERNDQKLLTETWSVPPKRTASSSLSASWTSSLLAIATLAIIGLGIALWYQTVDSRAKPATEQSIAKVTGTGGRVVWTGNGGLVSADLKIGSLLTGGTIEGTSPRSWVELEFLDGSRVTVAGDSRLTFSDVGQKILYLMEGSVASSVKPQKPDSPMLVYTRNSMLEVLGTEFEVQSHVETTSLDVTEGKVRLRRLSDGEVIDVPANQRVESSEGLELVVKPIPNRTSDWKGDLAQPYGKWGTWLPPTDSLPARLRPVHYRHKDPEGKVFLIKTAGMPVMGKDNERVVLRAGCKLRVRGFARLDQKAVFGVAVRDDNGDFGGYYDSADPDLYWVDLQTDSEPARGNLAAFEFTIDAADLSLGAESVKADKDFADSPIDQVVDVFYCTIPAENSDMEITSVEILQSSDN